MRATLLLAWPTPSRFPADSEDGPVAASETSCQLAGIGVRIDIVTDTVLTFSLVEARHV